MPTNRFGRYFCFVILIATIATSAKVRGEDPPDEATFERQLKRVPWQTQFISSSPPRYYTLGSRSSGAVVAAGAIAYGSGEEVHEADIKVIDKKTGNLILLHAKRGILVIDKTRTKILGRAIATGNAPKMAYIDEKNRRLIVIETQSVKPTKQEGQQLLTHVLSYDIDDPGNITLPSRLTLPGHAATSRMIGTNQKGFYLYLANSVYDQDLPEERRYRGEIVAVKLGKELEVAKIHAMGTPGAQTDSMQVLEDKNSDGNTIYYLAAMVERGEGWSQSWSQDTDIELVRIGGGEIEHVLSVQAKGQVERPSQIHLANGILFAVSNYMPDTSDKMRLAFESWILPTSTTKPLSSAELAYRQAWVNREMERVAANRRGAHFQKLNDNKENGLRGNFARLQDGRISKLVPDGFLWTGDSTGEDADLQSVRFIATPAGEQRVYASWVPANMKDPIDAVSFDAQGIPHKLGRLQFPGWIEHTRPIRYQGKLYILGIGYAVDASGDSDNETVQRPMAKLVEVDETSAARHQLKEIATYIVKGEDLRYHEDSRDLDYDLRYDEATGEGVFMIPVDSYTSGFAQGGKLLGFSIPKALAEDSTGAFAEGQFLQGRRGWLERAFREGDDYFAYTTKSLTQYRPFGSPSDGMSFVHATFDAIGELEIARNVLAYTQTSPGSRYGIQFVEKNKNTELRLVSEAIPDAEITEVLHTLSLHGIYAVHKDLGSGNFLIVTLGYEHRDGKNIHVAYANRVRAYSGTKTLRLLQRDAVELGKPRIVDSTFGIEAVDSKRLIAVAGRNLLDINMSGGGLTIEPLSVDIKGAEFKYAEITSILRLNGIMTVAFSVPIDAPEKYEERDVFTRNYVAELVCDGDTGSCTTKTPINIPGVAMGTVRSTDGKDFLVVRDRTVTHLDSGDHKETPLVTSMNHYISLRVDGDRASLVDIVPTTDASFDNQHQVGAAGPFITLVHPTDSEPRFRRSVVVGSRVIRDRSPFTSAIETLYVADGGKLAFRRTPIDTSLEGASLSHVLVAPRGEVYGIISQGSEIQAFRWQIDTQSLTSGPELLDVSVQQPNLQLSMPAGVGSLPSYIPRAPGNRAVALDAANPVLTLALEDAGVCRILLTRPDPKPEAVPQTPKRFRHPRENL